MPVLSLLASLLRRRVRKTSESLIRLQSGQAWLEATDANIRYVIETAIERGNGDPIPPLLGVMAGTNEGLRTTAAQALGVLVRENPATEHRKEVIDALLDALYDGILPREVYLSGGRWFFMDDRATLRGAAAEALATIADPSTIDWLILALTLTHQGARRYAAIGLGRIGDPRAVPALVQALNDPESDVRASVIEALQKIGTPEALQAFEDWRSKRTQQDKGFF